MAVESLTGMQIETRQFGVLAFEEAAILYFPAGLLGFEQLHRFLLIDQDEIAPLQWLQSIDEPALAFTVITPSLVWPDYQPRLLPSDREVLSLRAGEEPVVLALVTVPKDPKDMTANLMGPLVLSPTAKLGLQVVQHDAAYATRERLIPDAAREDAVTR